MAHGVVHKKNFSLLVSPELQVSSASSRPCSGPGADERAMKTMSGAFGCTVCASSNEVSCAHVVEGFSTTWSQDFCARLADVLHHDVVGAGSLPTWYKFVKCPWLHL